MTRAAPRALDVLIVALPETAGSALYGMVDVLSAAGHLWQTLVRSGDEQRRFQVRIVSMQAEPFRCGNDVPVQPHCAVADDPSAPVVIVPELWLGPDESLSGRYPALVDWLQRRYRARSNLYSACSGAVLLAETGLLDGRAATSHWGYADLFRTRYPKVRFDPAPNLIYADPEGRTVTAGGTTSWHDLALHLIARHCSPGEAQRTAKVYLLKYHAEGQLPYAALVRRAPHGDAMVRDCERWLEAHYREPDALARVVELAGIPERTLKRRFRAATGSSLIEYLQNLRVEEAKRLLEGGSLPVDEISAKSGYSDVSFFRRVFKRSTGVTPREYRRLFRPMPAAAVPRSRARSAAAGEAPLAAPP